MIFDITTFLCFQILIVVDIFRYTGATAQEGRMGWKGK